MNEILIMALASRVRAAQMTLEQVPYIYKEKVRELISDGEY